MNSPSCAISSTLAKTPFLDSQRSHSAPFPGQAAPSASSALSENPEQVVPPTSLPLV